MIENRSCPDEKIIEERWVTVEGGRRVVVLEWGSEAERAAAALLASALRLAGYRSTRLRRDTRSLCTRSQADDDHGRSE